MSIFSIKCIIFNLANATPGDHLRIICICHDYRHSHRYLYMLLSLFYPVLFLEVCKFIILSRSYEWSKLTNTSTNGSILTIMKYVFISGFLTRCDPLFHDLWPTLIFRWSACALACLITARVSVYQISGPTNRTFFSIGPCPITLSSLESSSSWQSVGLFLTSRILSTYLQTVYVNSYLGM